MKKIAILFAFIISASVITSCGNNSKAKAKINQTNLKKAEARDLKIKKETASISLDKKAYDFGTVKEGTIVKTSFKVTNTSKTANLIISNAVGSCSCTVPTWPKEPIKPGETKDISIRFDTAGRPNKQMKTVTLTTNTKEERQVFVLKGAVTPKPRK